MMNNDPELLSQFDVLSLPREDDYLAYNPESQILTVFDPKTEHYFVLRAIFNTPSNFTKIANLEEIQESLQYEVRSMGNLVTNQTLHDRFIKQLNQRLLMADMILIIIRGILSLREEEKIEADPTDELLTIELTERLEFEKSQDPSSPEVLPINTTLTCVNIVTQEDYWELWCGGERGLPFTGDDWRNRPQSAADKILDIMWRSTKLDWTSNWKRSDEEIAKLKLEAKIATMILDADPRNRPKIVRIQNTATRNWLQKSYLFLTTKRRRKDTPDIPRKYQRPPDLEQRRYLFLGTFSPWNIKIGDGNPRYILK